MSSRLIHRWSECLNEGARGVSFVTGLVLYLRRPHTPERARAIVRTRLASRELNFLGLARQAIFGDRCSPYLALLRHVGCEYGDLERLVRKEGIEGALTALYGRGVYLSHQELMGSAPAIRGSLRLEVGLKRLRSRLAFAPAEPTEVGERSGPRPMHYAMFSGLSANAIVALEARQGLGWSHAFWHGPSPPAAHWLCRRLVAGYPPPVWYSRHNPRSPDLTATGKRLGWTVPPIGRLVGAPIPTPVYVPFQRPAPIVEWMSRELGAGRTPHLGGNVTLAIMLVQLAGEMGVDLTGAQFSVSQEAITGARKAAIGRTGGAVYPVYGAKESEVIAQGCLNPSWPDEMHLMSDCQAIIRAGGECEGSALAADELLITTLQRWWPIVLLNASLGDRADLAAGSCGCPLEQLGWSVRVHTVRAFRKLKIGIRTNELAPILKLLEQTLPERFGGGPLSYQLVGLDDRVSNALVGLSLVVDPAVGPIDEPALLELVSGVLQRGSGYFMADRDRSGWITIERRRPYQTPSGKILQVCHRSTTSDATVVAVLGT